MYKCALVWDLDELKQQPLIPQMSLSPYEKCLIASVAFSDSSNILLPAEFCMHTRSPHPWIQEPKLAAKSRKQKVGHIYFARTTISHFETKTSTMISKLPTSLMTTSYTSSLGFSTNISLHRGYKINICTKNPTTSKFQKIRSNFNFRREATRLLL